MDENMALSLVHCAGEKVLLPCMLRPNKVICCICQKIDRLLN